MVVPPSRQHLILPVAPLAAAAIGIVTAGVFALLTTDMLESLIVDSGIAAVLTAAEPPLGVTARAVLVLLCGGGVAVIAWFALFLAFGTRSVVLRRGGMTRDGAPVLRRADAHPDAPARPPLFANRDLGTPFLDVRARPVHIVADLPALAAPVPEARPIPADLEQPLAIYDPAAMPEEPLDWFAPPASLKPAAPTLAALAPEPIMGRQTFAPGERLETFALTPVAPPDPAVTIHALLDRLERSVARREPEPEPERVETLQDTLSNLRKMATRGGA